MGKKWILFGKKNGTEMAAVFKFDPFYNLKKPPKKKKKKKWKMVHTVIFYGQNNGHEMASVFQFDHF